MKNLSVNVTWTIFVNITYDHIHIYANIKRYLKQWIDDG